MQETSLGRILSVLRARSWLVLLLAVPVVLAALWFARSQPPMYQSQIVLTFSPGPAGTADNAFVRLVPRYLLTATAATSLRTAEAAAGLPSGALGNAVTAENPTGSLQLELTATTGDAGRSETAVAALADSVLSAADADPLVDAQVIVGPTEPTDVTPIRRQVAVAAGTALSVVPGITLAFILEGLRPRIRIREDVEQLGIPVVLSTRRRELRRMVATRRGRVPDVLTSVRLQMTAGAPKHGTRAVVVTSVAPFDAASVARLAEALSRPTGGGDRSGEVPGAVADEAIALARPALLSDEAAQAAVRAHGKCLLVLSARDDVERAEECVQLLRRLDADRVGGVLVR
ncbi:Wzz/FepE/Etk N-terminal domain-containing protein [Geodermatophilus maliterrae]|uniref:Wzz/FepE/Etk N-terminal domain-containing protein n=1 Tax=Geodermatophilus maliterrae TaxID=3162531 RepID=A0ABV3XIW2_9ACTN